MNDTELPSGWREIPLGQAGTWRSGGTPSKERSDYWGGSIPWVSAKDLKTTRLRTAIDMVTEAGVEAGSRLLPARSLVMLVRGMTLAHSFPVALLERPMAFNQDLKGLECSKEVDPEYLLHYLSLHEQDVLGLITNATHGTCRLSTDELQALPLRLPALAEQRKIAEVLSSVDRVIEATVFLAASVRREAAALNNAIFSTALEEGAECLHLGELLETKYGTSAKCEHDPTGLPVLRIPNVCDRALDLGDLKHLPPSSLRASEREGLRLRHGDLLMVRSNGNPALVTRMAFFDRPQHEEWLYASFLIRLRVTDRRLNPRFLWWFSQTRNFEDQARPLVRTSTGLNNINSESLQSISIILPSPERQAQIVSALDAVRAKALAEGTRVSRLRRLKLGLLQDLLTGRRRVALAESVVA